MENALAILLAVLGVFLILGLVWILILKGRQGAKGKEDFQGYFFAHRGFHQKEAPENSLPAFARAVDNGFGAEMDVHLLKDGTLAIFHDHSLERMTGKKGVLEKLTLEQLKDYPLKNTKETIPTLQQVLSVFGGRTPLIIELKTYQGNAYELCERVMQVLDKYKGAYCIESFDPHVVYWMKKHRPCILRGQLSTNFLKSRGSLSLPAAFASTNLLGNLFTRPDFIAYSFKYRRGAANQLCLRLWKLQGASWTLRNPRDFQQALKEGLWPIFEGFDPRTGESLKEREEKSEKEKAREEKPEGGKNLEENQNKKEKPETGSC